MIELGALYVLVGLGCAVARVASRARARWRAADAILLMVAWPLYGPFALVSEPRRPGRYAEDAPLSWRLQRARRELVDIEEMMRRPEFSEPAARSRLDMLIARGASPRAVTAVRRRLANARRLAALRDRLAAELDEVTELAAHLDTQVQLARLAGRDDGALQALRDELAARIAALDDVFGAELGRSGHEGPP